MTDYKTMRVPEDAWTDAKGAKREDETWGEYLRRCADVDTGSTTDTADSTTDVDTGAIASEVARRLDYTRLATAVADEVEGRMR